MKSKTWRVVSFDMVKEKPRGDGDTVWLKRSINLPLGDDWYTVTDIEHKSHRLVWVDAPERGQPGYHQADQDLNEWILQAQHEGPLKAVVYEESAGWDRKLCDLINCKGQSASQYLIVEKGWPLYGA